MSASDPIRPLTEASWFRDFPRWTGALVACMGGLVMVGWHAHWQRVLQLVPNTAPMQFNTALCLALCGLGLVLLTTRRVGVATWLGGAAGLLAGLTMVEYVTKKDLGIDLLFGHPFFEVATTFPGRMSPLSAVCFMFLAGGVVLADGQPLKPRRRALVGVLACMTAVISGVALCGYAFNIEPAYGWGAYSRMAVNTAVLLGLCSGGLLMRVWQTAWQEENYSLLRWLPTAGSVTLMAMVASVATVNAATLRQATFWREHTLQVILAAQSFEDSLLDIQRGLRGYVTLGDTNALAAYHASLALEPPGLEELTTLTEDNPAQQRRLQSFARAIHDVLAFDERLLGIYEQQGFPGISRLDETGEGRRLSGAARDILKAFSQEERNLLVIRDAAEQADHKESGRLLVFGSIVAAVLLLLGNVMASREMRRRRRAEAILTDTLTLQNAILNSARYAIVAMDRVGVVKTFNPAAERMLGYGAEEIIGRATPHLWREMTIGPAMTGDSEPERLLPKTGFARLGESETNFMRKDGEPVAVLVSVTALADAQGGVTGFLAVIGDISERKHREAEREKMIAELREALAQVKTLSGLIPICAWCKSVRSDKGYWETVEQYVHSHTDATFTHGICPKCTAKFKGEKQVLKAEHRE